MTESDAGTAARNIHWVGFGVSLISAPLLFSLALLGPLVLLGTINDDSDLRDGMAVLQLLITIGATLYFVIGTPVLIYHLKRHAPDIGRIIRLALLSVLAILPLGALLSLLTLDPAVLMFAGISTCFGFIGAPVLAMVFTTIYKRFSQT